MDADESSTRLETCAARSCCEIRAMCGSKALLLDRGTMRTLVGATRGGNDRT